MFVTTATSGVYSSSEPSLSSASATKQSPLPWWALVPASPRSPPTANDGSKPHCCNATMSMEVVVVLPCVPVDHRRGVLGHQLGQHHRPQYHRNATPTRLDEFGIGLGYRGVGGHDGRRRRPAAGPATTRHGRCGPPRRARAKPTTPRDSLASDPDTSAAAVEQDAGDARHTRSPDAHHVHPLQFVGSAASAFTRAALRRRATSSATSATRWAASRCPASAAAAVIA